MFVSYKFWTEVQDFYEGSHTATGDKNLCLTMDRIAAIKLYNELKKEFG